MENLKRIENNFIRTGVFNLSVFFKVNRESKNKKVEFDLIKPTALECHGAEYKKEIQIFDEAWINSVLK